MPESVRGSSSTMRSSVGQLVAGEHPRPRRSRRSSAATAGGARRAARPRRPAPRRAAASARLTTAAPRTRGVALERGADVVGPDLEAAADDRLVGAAEDPEEAVGVDAGQVGGAHPAGRRPAGRPSPRAGPRRRDRAARPSRRRRPAARSRRGPGRRSPASPPRTARWSLEVPARDAAAELGGGVGRRAPARRTSSRNASASSGSSGAVPETTERTLARSARIEVGLEHHAQRGGHEADGAGRCRRTASTQSSTVNRSSRQNDRPSFTHCSTRNSPPRCTSGELTMATPVPQPDVASRVATRSAWRPTSTRSQRLVGEGDPLRRPGRAAREHLAPRRPGAPVRRASPRRARHRSRDRRRAELVAARAVARRSSGTRALEVVGLAGDDGEVERRRGRRGTRSAPRPGLT